MSHSEENKYRFDSAYRERVRLNDGAQLTLRLVIPADKLLLAHGMDNFSSESRYRRFLAGKQALTNAELAYLTELDGVDHFAIGALHGEHEGVGVARFVRFGDKRETAEPAVAVLDAYQNKGLGKILFVRLMAAARERGIRHFHGITLADNDPMKRLLKAVGTDVRFQYKGRLLEFDMSVA